MRTKEKATSIDPAEITEKLRQIIEEQENDGRSDFDGSSWASHLTSAEIETLKTKVKCIKVILQASVQKSKGMNLP